GAGAAVVATSLDVRCACQANVPPAPITAATTNPPRMRTRLPDFVRSLMICLVSKPVGRGNTLMDGSGACGSPGSLASAPSLMVPLTGGALAWAVDPPVAPGHVY